MSGPCTASDEQHDFELYRDGRCHTCKEYLMTPAEVLLAEHAEFSHRLYTVKAGA